MFCTNKVHPAVWSEVSAIRIFDLYYCESSQRWPERDLAAKRVVANKTLQSLDLGWIGSEFSTKENVMQTFGTFIVCTVLDFFLQQKCLCGLTSPDKLILPSLKFDSTFILLLLQKKISLMSKHGVKFDPQYFIKDRKYERKRVCFQTQISTILIRRKMSATTKICGLVISAPLPPVVI